MEKFLVHCLKNQVDKQAATEKKIEIQLKLMEEVGLVIDMPKSSGSGTSNKWKHYTLLF